MTTTATNAAAARAARRERRNFEAEHPIVGPNAEKLLYTPTNTAFDAAAETPPIVANAVAAAPAQFAAVAERQERFREQVVQSDDERAARAEEAAAALPEDAETRKPPGVDPDADSTEPDDGYGEYESWSKADLAAEARNRDIAGRSKMSTEELVQALRDDDAAAEAEGDEPGDDETE